MPSLRSSPTHAMEALRHEHERDLVEVKGIAVWILNVLVDATRHHGETETADQNSGLVDLHSRKGKGRAANGDQPVGAASCRQEYSTMASCQNPLIPRMTWIAPPRGLLGRGTRRACREHANDTATHVELPVKKIWYSESASTRHDSVALHRRGYGMRWTVEHVPMVLRMVSRLGPGTTVDAPVEP